MRTISAALDAEYQSTVTTIVKCCRIERTDGYKIGLTNHDQPLPVDSDLTYQPGYTPTAVQTTAKLNVDNMDIEGWVNSPLITEADLHARKWDYAQAWIFEVNWMDLSQGRLRLRRARLGEVSIKRGKFSAELNGMMQNYSRRIIELTQPGCNARFGDARCTIDLTPFTASGTVMVVTNQQSFTTTLPTTTVQIAAATSGTPFDGYFSGGPCRFLSGANTGLEMEVKSYDATTGAIELQLPIGFDIQVGDSLTAIGGCSKRLGTVSNYTTDSATYAIGATSIVLASGTGMYAVGDQMSIGSDNYTVTGLASGNVSFTPGLLAGIGGGTAVSFIDLKGCKAKDNIVNFRGFPYFPGSDKALRVGV